jgi:hypothetical protein
MWLNSADCWRCGTSITLDELHELDPAVRTETVSHPTRETGPTSLGAIKMHDTASDPLAAVVASPLDWSELVDHISPSGTATIPRRAHRPAPIIDLSQIPAWLASLLLHLFVLILLALIHFRRDTYYESITLSTMVGLFDREDVIAKFVDPVDNIAFDLPVPEVDRPVTERQRKALMRANDDAQRIRFDPDEPHPELPDLERLKRAIGTDPNVRTLAVRDPRLRVEMIRQEGGTTLTEAAVARGLLWMARHQNDDGSWSLDGFDESPRCRGQCSGQGDLRSNSAATSLCLLPFLGAGQTHFSGRYKDSVSSGLRWMLTQQKPDGDLRGSSSGQVGMYAHGQSAIVLCEAYALTLDESLRQPAQRAIDFIVAAQHPGGGWRYQPGEEGDTSVFGWQIMALQSARAAGLDVAPGTLELAAKYLESVQSQRGSRYAYRPRQEPTHIMTAEALLCRMYMGWTMHNRPLKAGISFLAAKHLPDPHEFDVYYWYYATQVMHHAGGRNWRKWNQSLREILVHAQETAGHEAGSWAPRGPHAHVGGRIYVTSLAVCTLEVYYRHAPIFRSLDIR